MGLDQYITIRHKSTNAAYAKWENYCKLSEEESKEVRKPKEPDSELTIGYFRKHNMIHGYFVDHVQGGVDDCGTYKFEYTVLEDLIQICKNVMSYVTKTERPPKYIEDGKGNKCECFQYPEYKITMEGLEYAMEYLPLRDGFFFGTREYNDDYFWCVENAIEELTFALQVTQKNYFKYYTDKKTGKYDGKWVLEYHSSW